MKAKRRIGSDNSFLPLMAGPVGLGIPKWLPLVAVYFGVIFALAWSEPSWPRSATLAAALGPGVIGLIDLTLRLRTTHYEWINSEGRRLVGEASVIDRLTFRECGWYLPIINLPLPLWLLGMGLSTAFTHSWRLV